MAIPDFQSMMRPMLEVLASRPGEAVPNTVLRDVLTKQFSITEDEFAVRLPSGAAGKVLNRMGWAKTHMKGAGLITSPKRATAQITPRGIEFLKNHPGRLTIALLEQFPEYVAFRTSSTPETPAQPTPQTVSESELTPEEHLELGYQELRNSLSQDILGRIKECPPEFFEELVVELLLAMGYGGSRRDAGQAIGRSGDGGIDGIIKEDRLGLDAVYIQAKRWEGVVGRPEVQKFAGALQGQRASKGIFLTTSSFSREAHEYVAGINTKIVLIDGPLLAGLMIDHGVGVTTVVTYSVKRLDSDYFAQE